jgi:hypothetical protein
MGDLLQKRERSSKRPYKRSKHNWKKRVFQLKRWKRKLRVRFWTTSANKLTDGRKWTSATLGR